MKPYIFPSSIETARALILHLVKLMLDDRTRLSALHLVVEALRH